MGFFLNGEIGVTFYSSLENMNLWLFGDETNYSVV